MLEKVKVSKQVKILAEPDAQDDLTHLWWTRGQASTIPVRGEPWRTRWSPSACRKRQGRGDSRQPLFGAKGAPAIGFQVHCRHLQPRPSSQCHRERGSRNLRGEVCCFTARSRLVG